MSLHRFDHAAAKAYFVGLDPGERSSQAVAEKFSVSRRTVDKWRKLDGWNDAAAEHDRSIGQALERQAVKSREQRALQDARIRDLAAGRVESKLRAAEEGTAELTDDWVRQVLQDADKRVRLNEGEATDHVAVAQVQAGFRELMGASHELVAEAVFAVLGETDEARVIVQRFRAELPGRVQERLALVGGDGDA